ncbi:hypothetical protein BDQ94DRAFT_140611 [Aspergillus welwitschiae]|uniref:Uncharacterized protein n=1 Tax=Aspergillus welwitschiae TaxID=1341132 RepID=A0A3F3Q992_9EURO|nr:hypothetical protein BDQ94DRAFT_140611 [Aspergillus welwitschiae]RDH35306.1 hypothetical protein BDQ94DRAFT_140611 [Aspergillus welwitschiae]
MRSMLRRGREKLWLYKMRGRIESKASAFASLLGLSILLNIATARLQRSSGMDRSAVPGYTILRNPDTIQRLRVT